MTVGRMGWGIGMALLVFLGGCSLAPEKTRERAVIGDATQRDQRHRETGYRLPVAASNLLANAEGMLGGGDTDRALNLTQRAQRIAPDSAQVYYVLGRVYQKRGDYARAEQFVLKGLNKAGRDARLSRSGWSLLAEIRDSRGDEDGARRARERAARF